MPVEGRSLTKEEFSELDELSKKLIEDALAYNPTLSEDSSPLVDIRHAQASFDLDGIRSYAKLLPMLDFRIAELGETMFYLHGEGILETSSWLTVDHVKAYSHLHRSILIHEQEQGAGFDTLNNRRVCGLLFPDPSRAGFIESLVERGITSVHDIKRALQEIPVTHSAVHEGAL